MDYYDDNPLKVTKFMPHLKKMRREQRKARKALKTKRMADLLAKQEAVVAANELQQSQFDESDEGEYIDFYEREKMKKCIRFSLQDSFNWDELEEELNGKEENIASEDEDASDSDNE